VFTFIINPLEGMALKYAALVVKGLSGVTPGGGSGYAALSCGVESQMMRFLELVWSIAARNALDHGMLSASTFIIFVAVILLMLPFLFVVALFTAFMVEALFKFVAIGVISPVLLLLIPFPVVRAFSFAGLRIVVGAALTLVMVAGAMGFTMKTVDKYADKLAASVDLSTREGDAASEAAAEAHRKWRDKCLFDNGSDECKALFEDWWKKKEAADDGTSTFSIFSREYFMMFAIGMASILLHIQAKGLASNLASVQDGAGPAAAVVAGGKTLLGVGVATAMRGQRMGSTALFGQGGPGGALGQIAQALPGPLGAYAEAARHGGAIGAAIAGGVSAATGQGMPGAGFRRPPMPSLDGASIRLDQRSIQDLAGAMAEAMNKVKQ